MIQRKNFEAAYNIMAKIYAHATPDQVDLKVRFRFSVHRSSKTHISLSHRSNR